ncbi:Ppx/GppA phosphatase family protein [Nocardioides sp. Kera G14]|uniref:Ppx/GppA phosphatase family protein n=1 Tax=Nocardioides sp. Kera G14 TaxID=2884264 RepID=UPI001D10572D|nr:Ppx/GppA phosphatase family protein [Nocardioides sp. Kera G14]UDY22986.1 Ppx/GppA family phosphatase [Nocardioides sp. Kera G14]
MKVAAIDCGTNTIKLLVGSVDGGALTVEVKEARMVRLGEGLDQSGVISEGALKRAFTALDEYADLIRDHGAERIRFVATSATRDAANADVFTAGVRERLGVEPEVVAGTEEAALAFDGAVRNLRAQPAQPVMIIDIGGGSTELIYGADDAFSMQIGSVRQHERHLRSDPPTMEEIAACVADIDDALDASPVSAAGAASVIGVAGTITTIAAGVLDLPAYDREAIDQAVLPVGEVHALVDRLVAMTVSERLTLPWMHPGRADVIAAGGLILSRMLRRAPVDELLISEADILDGIAWSLA